MNNPDYGNNLEQLRTMSPEGEATYNAIMDDPTIISADILSQNISALNSAGYISWPSSWEGIDGNLFLSLDLMMPAFQSLHALSVAKSATEAKDFTRIVDEFFKGETPKSITNKAGDKIFMSENRKIRFDFINSHGDDPHVHFEKLDNGEWKDAFSAHRFYPMQK